MTGREWDAQLRYTAAGVDVRADVVGMVGCDGGRVTEVRLTGDDLSADVLRVAVERVAADARRLVEVMVAGMPHSR